MEFANVIGCLASKLYGRTLFSVWSDPSIIVNRFSFEVHEAAHGLSSDITMQFRATTITFSVHILLL